MSNVEDFQKDNQNFWNTDSFGVRQIFSGIYDENKCLIKLRFLTKNETECSFNHCYKYLN